jgi:hypothetical protein
MIIVRRGKMHLAQGKLIAILVAIAMIAVVMFAGVMPVSAAQVNQPPVACIDSIYPSPATEGNVVCFRGHGTDPDRLDLVVGYNWRSTSIDGQLSTSRMFATRDLSVGEHTIYFKVKDRHGAWSEEVSQTLLVKALPAVTPPPVTLPQPIIYKFDYYAKCVGHGIGETDSDYWECDNYEFQVDDYISGVSFGVRSGGPTQAWLASLGEYSWWCPFVPVGFVRPRSTDLLVYEDAEPASGNCFPPESSYYGRITLYGSILGRWDSPTDFRPGHWYYITTCGFQTLYPHQPITPPTFSYTYGFTGEQIVQDGAEVLVWDCKKKIADIPCVCMGRVEEFYIIYSGNTYSDDDADGRISTLGFSVWIENALGEVGRICDSTIYARSWRCGARPDPR